MDHADVLEQLESAMASPGKLRAIDADQSLEGIELRRHLEECEECAGEYRAWWTASRALDAATPETLRAPADARFRILTAITTNSPRRTAAKPMPVDVPQIASADAGTRAAPTVLRPRAAPGPAWIALAAAAAVLLFVLGAFLGGPLGLAPAASPETEPAIPLPIAQAVDRVLRQPDHRQVTLRTAAGEPAGSLLFDPASRELVVLTDRLPPASSGGDYDCFIERTGERTRVGSMGTVNGFSFWAGPMDEPADAGRRGDRFLVVEERPDGTDGSPVLIGDL